MRTNTFTAIVAGLLMAAAAAVAQAAVPAAGTQPQDGTGAIFAALDTNKDGTLSRQEFQAGYPGLARAIALELRLREQFQALDADHSGAIEAGEYANLELVRRAGKSAPALAGFDANHDQKLEFAEYVVAVRRLATRAAAGKK